MTKDTVHKRALSIGLLLSSLMLVGTVVVLIVFGPTVVSVGNLVVAICNVVVFASIHKRRSTTPFVRPTSEHARRES